MAGAPWIPIASVGPVGPPTWSRYFKGINLQNVQKPRIFFTFDLKNWQKSEYFSKKVKFFLKKLNIRSLRSLHFSVTCRSFGKVQRASCALIQPNLSEKVKILWKFLTFHQLLLRSLQLAASIPLYWLASLAGPAPLACAALLRWGRGP